MYLSTRGETAHSRLGFMVPKLQKRKISSHILHFILKVSLFNNAHVLYKEMLYGLTILLMTLNSSSRCIHGQLLMKEQSLKTNRYKSATRLF